MATDNELTRIADMANALRPEWNARSVRHVLATGRYGASGLAHRDRAFADLAVAVAAMACDPASQTPGRLAEHGHWWLATRANMPGAATPDVGPGRGVTRCQNPGHEHEPAHACRACRAEAIAQPDQEPTP